MVRRIRRLLLAAATIVLLTFAAAPPASAQSGLFPSVGLVRLAAPDGANDIVPGGDPISLKIIVQVRTTTGAVCPAPFSVHLAVALAPAYATAILYPTDLSFMLPTPNLGEPVEGVSHLLLSTSRDAPADQAGLYEVRASVTFPPPTSGCLIASPGPSAARISLPNAYVADLRLGDPVWNADQDGFLVHVVNLANGPTRVSAEPANPSQFAGFSAPDLVLESPVQGGPRGSTSGSLVIHAERADASTAPAIIRVHAVEAVHPGASSGFHGTFELPRSPRAAADSAVLAGEGLATLAQLPAPSPLAILAVVGATALFVRRLVPA